MKKYLLVLLLVIFIIPSIAFASWWNPFSWSWFGLFSNSAPQVEQQINNTTTQIPLNNPSQPTTTQPIAQSTVFSNQYLSINVLPGWKATQPSSVPQSVNIVKGNYILYINPLFGHASGIQGGRFSEIVGGMPGISAVVTNQGMADGYNCNQSTNEILHITDKLSLWNLFTDSSKSDGVDEDSECNFPSDGQTAWFGAYDSGSASDVFGRTTAPDNFNEYAVTVAYNTNDVNKFPKKGSIELTQTLSDVSAMLKTLKLKNVMSSATTKTYQNTTFGVSFNYPSTWTSTTDTGAMNNYGISVVPTNANSLITLKVPTTAYPSTDFGGGYLNLSVSKQLNANQCWALNPQNNSTPGQGIINIDGVAFNWTSMGGAAAGTDTGSYSYSGYTNGTCYEFNYSDVYYSGGIGMNGITGTNAPENDIKNVITGAIFTNL